MTTPYQLLEDFLLESNRLSGIFHFKPDEIEAAEKLLKESRLTVERVQNYVDVIAPNTKPVLPGTLEKLLACANSLTRSPRDVHVRFMLLEPYVPAALNGRVARMVWLWQKQNESGIPQESFLKTWYLDSLDV